VLVGDVFAYPRHRRDALVPMPHGLVEASLAPFDEGGETLHHDAADVGSVTVRLAVLSIPFGGSEGGDGGEGGEGVTGEEERRF
jgi:hypothetical protein